MTKKAEAGRSDGGKQTFFLLAPDATSVELAGDFTHWTGRPIALRKGHDGMWQVTITLPPGTHHYRFLVDGQWRDDPQSSMHIPNPYGGQDCVRQVT